MYTTLVLNGEWFDYVLMHVTCKNQKVSHGAPLQEYQSQQSSSFASKSQLTDAHTDVWVEKKSQMALCEHTRMHQDESAPRVLQQDHWAHGFWMFLVFDFPESNSLCQHTIVLMELAPFVSLSVFVHTTQDEDVLWEQVQEAVKRAQIMKH